MNKNVQNKQKKAVILITIDALRPDHLKSYGYHLNTAPFLDKLAKTGTIFKNAVTNGPETPTAFSSLFTSILPLLAGGYSPLPSQKIYLTQLLKENNIFTFSIHSNPNLGRFFNYDRGFDVFLDGERYKTDFVKNKNLNVKQILSFYVKEIMNSTSLFKFLMFRFKGFNKLKSKLRKSIPLLTDLLLAFTPIAYNAPYLVHKLLSFLNHSKIPLFIWAHFMDVHSPYNPPSRNILNFRKKDFTIAEREFLINKIYSSFSDIKITQKMIEDLKMLYDGEINFVDENLAMLFRGIKSKFKNNCLIIMTADHGESFYEHQLFGHQGSVYEEILKVPLIIIELGKNSIRKQVTDTVQLIDLAPTILDYYGIEIPDTYQGKSLLPLLKGNKLNRSDIIISECYQKKGVMKRNRNEGYILMAIRKLEWKYIYDEENNKEFLFNLSLDYQEQKNLIKEYPKKLDEFRVIKEYHLRKVYDLNEEQSKIVSAVGLMNKNKLK